MCSLRSCAAVLLAAACLLPTRSAVAATACEGRLMRLRDAAERDEQLKLARQLAGFLRGLGGERDVCATQVERALRGLLARWAASTRQGAGDDALALAQLWLELFPRHDKASLVRFARAGVLFELSRWRLAALAYGELRGLPTDKRKAAVRRAVLAWQKHLAARPRRPRERPGRRPGKPRPIADRRPMFAAFAAFVALAPGSDDAVTVLFRQGRVLYDHDHLGAAAKIFARIAEQHPRHALASAAAQLLLDVLNLQGKLEELTRWAQKLLAQRELARGSLRQTLQRILLMGLFRQAEQASQKQRFAECGQRYLAVVAAAPKDRLAPNALYNAAFCFERAGQLEQVIAARERLLRAYPTAAITGRTRFLLAGNYHQRKDHRAAAKLYTLYALQAPARDRDAVQGLLYAITVHVRAGERQRARALLVQLERRAGRHSAELRKARELVR